GPPGRPPSAGAAPGAAAGGGATGAAAGAGGAGAGPYSAVMSSRWPVLVSRVMVLARTGVVTVCSTTKSVGEFSLMTVSVPSPWELKASIVAGLKVAPSQPTPMGRSVMMWPSMAERMTMSLWSRQAAKRMLFLASSASPAQPLLLLERSYLPVMVMVLASMTAMAALSSMST